MHNDPMKSATLPSVRVDSQVRLAAEAVLREGETLSSFMSEALLRQIEIRRAQDEFIARGIASAARAKKSGDYVSPESVMAKLESMLVAHRAKKLTATKANKKRASA
jgi:predicted transcriptional regulator